MTHPLDHAATLVDHLIRTTGGGRVLCLGPGSGVLAAEFRRRAVDAITRPGPDGVLPFTLPADEFDLVVVDGVLDDLPEDARSPIIDAALRVTKGAVVVRARGRSRIEWEREVLAHACRKHPLHQLLIPYGGLDWEGPTSTLLVEPLPVDLTVGPALWDLAMTRDLHMDMLREAGCRADAHVARYMFARQFIRPGDRVVDAACGLGYGSAILVDGTLAESVEGVDADAFAIDYANDHYGRRRSRLSFAISDVMTLDSRPASSVDAIVSFETLEHLERPDAFLAACRRLLTPGGRLICSVPNEWLNDQGVDPNPYHLHVFNRERLEATCGRHFFIEHTYGQTAGQGMKLPEAGRRVWHAQPGEQDAEWWLLVGMTDPAGTGAGPVRHNLTSRPVDEATNVLAFDRDYRDPWLVRSMVSIGLRTESARVLTTLADRTIEASDPGSADAGAAMCVRAYRHLEQDEPLPDELVRRMTTYCDTASTVPHVRRWQISLCYVEGLSWLQQGDVPRAIAALEACAAADALAFSPILATKTVGAAFLLGWLAIQAKEYDRAVRCWTHAVNAAEAALHRPWDDFLLDRARPALFGLREAAVVVDLASQCATGLALIDQARERPGVVATQLAESLRDRLASAARALAATALPNPLEVVAADSGTATETTASGASLDTIAEPHPEPGEPSASEATIAAEPAPPPPEPDPEPPVWRLLDHLSDGRLTEGEPTQLDAWDVELDGAFTRNVFLHPPAMLEVTIPFLEAGRLLAKVAIHPEAWGREGASACRFTATVDDLAQASVRLDPHTHASHRHWVDLTVDVPATSNESHVLTLETRSLDAPHFGWALFRDVRFEPVVRTITPDGAGDGLALVGTIDSGDSTETSVHLAPDHALTD